MGKSSPVTIRTTEAGPYHKGDTVVFDVQPPDAGLIVVHGSRDGVLLSAWNNELGDSDIVIGDSSRWLDSPGPLHCEAMVIQIVRGRGKVVATCEFEIEA